MWEEGKIHRHQAAAQCLYPSVREYEAVSPSTFDCSLQDLGQPHAVEDEVKEGFKEEDLIQIKLRNQKHEIENQQPIRYLVLLQNWVLQLIIGLNPYMKGQDA